MVVVAGVAGALLGVLALWFVRFTYRLIWQRSPHGSARRLLGLDTSQVEATMRRSPISIGVWMCIDTVEVRDFTTEMLALLLRAGANSGGPGFDRKDIRDVLISMPEGGNEGLEALAGFLHKHGYRAAVEHWGSEHAHIHIGAATH